MKVISNKEVTVYAKDEIMTAEQQQISKKVRNAALKSFYENKIKSLDDHKLPIILLRMMCQDVPVQNVNLESKWGRNWFVRKCMKFYRGKLKGIERSEKTGFFSFSP